MSSRVAGPKRPSPAELFGLVATPVSFHACVADHRLLRMMSGPKVDIYVGKSKKHYPIPKQLLEHYSPYFDKCFNGSFIEGQTQKLKLPEDSVEDFDVLLDYMVYGNVSEVLDVLKTGKDTVRRCMSFFEYADKYGIADVEEAIHDPLEKALVAYGAEEFHARYIEVVYRITPSNSPLRILMAKAALSFAGLDNDIHPYQKQEEQVEGFAADLLKQTRASLDDTYWTDPLTGKGKRGGAIAGQARTSGKYKGRATEVQQENKRLH